MMASFRNITLTYCRYRGCVELADSGDGSFFGFCGGFFLFGCDFLFDGVYITDVF